LFSIQIQMMWAYRGGGSPPFPHGDNAGAGATVRDGRAPAGTGDAGGTGPDAASLRVVVVVGALVGEVAGPVTVLEDDTEPAATCERRRTGSLVRQCPSNPAASSSTATPRARSRETFTGCLVNAAPILIHRDHHPGHERNMTVSRDLSGFSDLSGMWIENESSARGRTDIILISWGGA
jgi:hypothetical protein